MAQGYGSEVSCYTHMQLTFWGLAVVNADHRLARALGPATKAFLVALGTHGDEATARVINYQLGRLGKLLFRSVEEEHGLDGRQVLAASGRARDHDILDDGQLGEHHLHRKAELSSELLLKTAYVQQNNGGHGETRTHIGVDERLLPRRSEHLDAAEGTVFAKLEMSGVLAW